MLHWAEWFTEGDAPTLPSPQNTTRPEDCGKLVTFATPLRGRFDLTTFQAMILGLLQGLGEFLPISSSAHLILVPWYFGWPDSGIAFDLALHMGTLAAVTVYFWRDLLTVATEALTRGTRTPMGRIGWGIALGTIPGVVFGLLLDDRADAVRSPVSIAILLALMGVALFLVDRRSPKNRSLEDVTILDIFLIGVGQACAIIPGVSRSGATITTALLRGLDREAAAKISFLLGWPIILGAGVFKLKDVDFTAVGSSFLVGVLVSAVSGYLVIAFLMDYLRRGTFLVFALYRAGLAAFILFVAMLRG